MWFLKAIGFYFAKITWKVSLNVRIKAIQEMIELEKMSAIFHYRPI